MGVSDWQVQPEGRVVLPGKGSPELEPPPPALGPAGISCTLQVVGLTALWHGCQTLRMLGSMVGHVCPLAAFSTYMSNICQGPGSGALSLHDPVSPGPGLLGAPHLWATSLCCVAPECCDCIGIRVLEIWDGSLPREVSLSWSWSSPEQEACREGKKRRVKAEGTGEEAVKALWRKVVKVKGSWKGKAVGATGVLKQGKTVLELWRGSLQGLGRGCHGSCPGE